MGWIRAIIYCALFIALIVFTPQSAGALLGLAFVLIIARSWWDDHHKKKK